METLSLNCKPFFSQHEFSSFVLLGVYILPQASMNDLLLNLSDQITVLEQKHSDSCFIMLGDFYRAKLNQELPKYRQHINCPTRDNN